jgi:glycosyltransferase involved in cell wall biosynthesis
MRRFGDAMEAGLDARPDVEMRSLRMRASPRAGPHLAGRIQRNLDEFVRFPASVRPLGTQRFDVFHITDAAHAHLLASLPPNRTVVSCHDLREMRAREIAPGRPTHDLLRGWRARVHAHGLRAAGAVVCSSPASARDIVRLTGVPENRIAVIPKGVGAEFVVLAPANRARARAGLGLAGHVVLAVASGGAWKNLPRVFRAVAALRADGLAVTLVRVGGPLAAPEQELGRELLGGGLLDLGRVSDARLVELYNASDLLLFPSLFEGFGRPPIEAMSCGLPVVASSAEPFADVLGDAALRPDPHDVAAIAAAARAVLLDTDLAAGLRARGFAVARRYTWPATVAAYVEVYRDVLRRSA